MQFTLKASVVSLLAPDKSAQQYCLWSSTYTWQEYKHLLCNRQCISCRHNTCNETTLYNSYLTTRTLFEDVIMSCHLEPKQISSLYSNFNCCITPDRHQDTNLHAAVTLVACIHVLVFFQWIVVKICVEYHLSRRLGVHSYHCPCCELLTIVLLEDSFNAELTNMSNT